MPQAAAKNDIQTRQLSLRADTADESNHSIEAVLSTANPVRMWDWDEWRVIDEILTTDGRMEDEHIPMLDSHMRWSVGDNLGHIENVRTEGGETVGVMMFDSTMDLARQTFNKYRDDHLRSVSVGYVVTRHVTIDAGETVEVEGVEYTADPQRKLRVALEWRLMEVSCVNKPADQGANVRQLEGVRSSQVTEEQALRLRKGRQLPFPNEDTPGRTGTVEKPSERSGGKSDPAEPTATRKGELNVAKETTTETPAEPRQEVNTDEVRQEAVQAERQRCSQIREIGADLVGSEVIERAINEGTEVEAFRDIALTAIREERKADKPVPGDVPHAIDKTRSHQRDCNVETLSAAIAMRMSNGNNLEGTLTRCQFNERTGTLTFRKRSSEQARTEAGKTLDIADQFRGLRFHDLCREALRLADVESPLDYDELAERAFSTPQLSSIFTNAMGAELLANFDEVPDSTEGWCREADSPDFFKKERHKVAGGTLTKHKRGGEADHAELSEQKEEVQAARYSRQFVLDEMNMADDPTAALQSAATLFGLGTANLRPDLVWALILSNPALSDGVVVFNTAGHANDFAGASIGQATIRQATAALHKQKDVAGNNLSLPASYLISDSDNADLAWQLAVSRESRGAAAETGTLNPVARHNMMAMGESRLSNGVKNPDTGITVAGAPGSWYLITNQTAYTIEVTYGLQGGRMPVIRSSALTQGKWGLSFDCKYDIGAGFLDHRGMVRSNG